MIKSFQGSHRWLSNFVACGVMLDGKLYPSTENAYQAAKTIILYERKPFEVLPPGKAKRAGSAVTMRADWDDVKLEIMYDLNKQKYDQSPYKRKLLATGTCEIQEGNTWGDTFWGICDDVGENNLGKILMRIRAELQAIHGS